MIRVVAKGTDISVPRRFHRGAQPDSGAAPRGQSGLSPSAFLTRIGLAAALFALLILFTPPAEPHIRLCGFYWITGHPCPLCGLTRGLFALAKGHVVEALRFNVLSPLAFVMVFSLFLTGRPAALMSRLWSAGIAAFAVYGLYRVVFV